MRWTEYYRKSDCWNKVLIAKFFLVMLLAVCLISCVSFEHLTVSGEQFAHAKECGHCHVDIYREWSQSDHANAYINPYFRKATSGYAFEECIGCHAPEPDTTERAPVARLTGREDGVTCVSCHLKEGKLAGPLMPTGAVKPHPIEVDEDYCRSSMICGRCHEGTQQEWNSVEGDKKTCQQCHMMSVERKVTQAAGGISNIIVAFEKKGMLRRHDFSASVDNIPGEIISVTGKKNGSLMTIQIINNLPHNLPTGDFGFRVCELQAIAIDKQNREIVLGQRELTPELSSAIPALGTLTWKVEVPPDVMGASIRLKRRSYEEEDVIVLANVEIPF